MLSVGCAFSFCAGAISFFFFFFDMSSFFVFMVSLSDCPSVFVGHDRVAGFLGFTGLFRDEEVLRCFRRISLLHGAVCAVLEIVDRSPRSLLHMVLGGQLQMRILQLAL